MVVVGAGNAGLSAALAARESGASVAVVESAPVHLRGGNSYFTGGLFRFAYRDAGEVLDIVPGVSDEERRSIDVGRYPQSEYYADVMRVTDGLSDPELVHTLVSRSYPTMHWMSRIGIGWVLAYGRQAFERDGVFRFWGGLIVEAVGGGKGLSDRQFDLAERAGVDILYETRATALCTDRSGRVTGLQVRGSEGYSEISSGAVVLACGGFEASSEMRARYLGPGWELAKVRGTRFNTGDGIRMALDAGAQSYGHWSGCHAVAWDLNAPPFGDRNIADLFQKHSYPFGLIVNADGRRFVDEGADFRNYTYARYGREILSQPGRVAFQLFDQRTEHLLRDEYRIPQATVVRADTLHELADGLGIDRERTGAYGRAVQRRGCARLLRSDVAGREEYERDRSAEVELGPAARQPSLPRLCRDLRDNIYLRRSEDRRPGPRPGYERPAHTGAVRGRRAGGRPLL